MHECTLGTRVCIGHASCSPRRSAGDCVRRLCCALRLTFRRCARLQIGYFLHQLILGVNEFCADGRQGLVYPNGTWFSREELACLTPRVPPTPPLPSGPPTPAKSFIVGGLKVGLRAGTFTVQNLGIVNDSVWGKNFSFVPPLWG